MTTQRIEVITSVERRRRWSREEKERLVAATLEPGAGVSEITRSAGIHVSKLFSVAQAALPDLYAVRPIHSRGDRRGGATHIHPSSAPQPSIVTIELGGGRRLRVESDVDTEALGRILDVLERR